MIFKEYEAYFLTVATKHLFFGKNTDLFQLWRIISMTKK